MALPEVAECKADMAAVSAAIAEILEALRSIPPWFGPQTWQGRSADLWAEDWNARRRELTALLDAVTEEQTRIIARLEKATASHAV